MKKQIIMMAALLVAMAANAQSEVNIEKLWGVPDEPVDINAPMTVKSGVAFIGDTRTPDKITDGKYKGMQVKKSKRYFKQGAVNVQYGSYLNFRGAASGIKTDNVIDAGAVPRSRMLQVKPSPAVRSSSLPRVARRRPSVSSSACATVPPSATSPPSTISRMPLSRVRKTHPCLSRLSTTPMPMATSCGYILRVASTSSPCSSRASSTPPSQAQSPWP